MLNDKHDTEGTIFSIREFTVHDGPGVRTTVFFKGCPMSCIWCHNPEGMDVQPTLMVRTAQCTDCGRCRQGCQHPDCQPFGRCLHICPRGLVSVAGKRVNADALAKKLAGGAMLYGTDAEEQNCDSPHPDTIRGGVTLSGGEPLLQPDFACALAGALREYGVHTALQTAGFASEDTFRRVLDAVDYVLFDLKLADDDMHRRYTGVSCVPIHKNLEILKCSGKPHVIRIPLIPGITDTDDNLRALALLAGDSAVELMPYNPYAGAKYPMVGKPFLYHEQETVPNAVRTEYFKHAKCLKN